MHHVIGFGPFTFSKEDINCSLCRELTKKKSLSAPSYAAIIILQLIASYDGVDPKKLFTLFMKGYASKFKKLTKIAKYGKKDVPR